MLDALLAPLLNERHTQRLYRERVTRVGTQGRIITLNNKRYLNFCSNNYLGFADHPLLIEAMQQAVAEYGVGSGASALVLGYTEAHARLEATVAEFLGRPRALLFSTGYMANVGVISALLNEQDVIIQDKNNHASLLDAARLARAKQYRYSSCDPQALAAVLKRVTGQPARRKLIVTEGVFSMSGTVAPLPEIVGLAKQHQAWLMVDDAHGFGVWGAGGRGTVSQLGLNVQDVPILMVTFGKALGVAGAVVAGSADLIDSIIQWGRSYIYTTAMPPAVAATATAALYLLKQEVFRLNHLQAVVSRFKVSALAAGLPVLPSDTPIQALWVGDTTRALAMSEALAKRGFWITAMRPPTVPPASARLRITLTALHTLADIDALVNALSDIWQKHEAFA